MTPRETIAIDILTEYDKIVTELQISWLEKTQAEIEAKRIQKEKYKEPQMSSEIEN